MIRSDAVPIQMWEIDCDTYNEEERFGLDSRCFCLPWQCTDEIKDQFQDEPGLNFSLLIYDEDDSLIDEIPYDETSDGVYLAAFTPSDNTPEFCDKKVQLKVRRNAGVQSVTLPALNLWSTSTLGANVDWTTGAAPTVNLPSIGAGSPISSEFLFVNFAFINGVEYSITLNFTRVTNSGTDNPRVATLDITDGSFNVQFTQAISSSNGANTITINFTANSNSTRIAFWYTSGSNVDITVNSASGTRSFGTEEVLAKSDCLNIKEEHRGTLLIAYSNHRNYAGIINNNGSPELTFYLRIPAVFNEERYPETDEPHQLSNNRIISLNSQVKKQKLLETDQMPNYMHLKMKEVLKHQFVTIEDVDYVKEEPYEQVENKNKRWPMRRYTCWLTEKEYVVRNIL